MDRRYDVLLPEIAGVPAIDDPQRLPAIQPAEYPVTSLDVDDRTSALPAITTPRQPLNLARFQPITDYQPTAEEYAAQGSGRNLPEITPTEEPVTPEPEQAATVAQAPTSLPTIPDPDQVRVDDLTKEYDAIKRKPPGHKHSKWSRIAAAIMGWAQGGLLGGIQAARNPHFFEDQKIEAERARLLPQIGVAQKIRDENLDAKHRKAQTELTLAKPQLERDKLRSRVDLEKTKFENRTKILEIQARNEGSKWKPYVDEQGRRWKQFQNDPSKEMEPILDPTTGEQDIDPNFKLYSYVDPTTGTEVQLTGRILSDRGTRMAEFNARQTQDAAKFNASQNLEAVKANVSNQFNYSKALYDRMADIAKSNAEAQGAMVNAQGQLGQMQSAAAQLEAINPEADPKGYAAAKKAFDDAEEKFYQGIAKTQAGASLVQQLSSQGLQRPGRVEFQPISATTLKPGTPSSKVSEDVFRQRLAANGITDPAMQKAMISKARTDGVIK